MSNRPDLPFPTIDSMAPVNREQFDRLLLDMSRHLQAEGLRAAAEAIETGAIIRHSLTPAQRDAKELASIQIHSAMRAAMIVTLEEAGKLADCDRESLLAEALFLRDEE